MKPWERSTRLKQSKRRKGSPRDVWKASQEVGDEMIDRLREKPATVAWTLSCAAAVVIYWLGG